MTSNVTRIATDDPRVFAFDITGEVGKDDIERMASIMNEAFDRREDVRMLLRFRPFEGRTWSSRFDAGAIKAQLRSLDHVEKYAVVGVPDAAQSFIDLMDNVIPVDARTFDRDEEQRAWEFVGAKPRH